MADDFDFYVGIDLAATKHQACLINETGKKISELSFEHSGDGIKEFCPLVRKVHECSSKPSRDCIGNAT